MEPSEILLLQEAKIDQDSLLILSKNKWKLNNGIVVSARGTCGGLATTWMEDKYTLLSSFATQHWIYSELLCSASRITFTLFNMYVPVNHVEKKECWTSLSKFMESTTL